MTPDREALARLKWAGLAKRLARAVDDTRKVEQAAGRLSFRDRYTPFVVEVETILRALTEGEKP